MSVPAINWAFRVEGLSSTERFVLVALADFADEQTNVCWPSQQMLAERTGKSVRTVKRVISSLQEAGLLDIERKRRASGHLGRNIYVLHTAVDNPLPGDTGVPWLGDTDGPWPGDTGVPSKSNHQAEQPPDNPRPPDGGADGGAVDNPKPSRTRKRDHLFEALAEVCGLDWRNLTKSERGRLNRAASELRAVGDTADSVRELAAAYRKTWPGITVTPQALAANRGALSAATDAASNRRFEQVFCQCGLAFKHHEGVRCEYTGEDGPSP